MVAEATMDLPAVPDFRKPVDLRPLDRNPEEMDTLIKQLEVEGFDREAIGAKVQSAEEQEKLITALKTADPSINGNAANLLEDIKLYQQEAKLERTWWDYIKELPGKTWSYAKETIKAHPYITMAVVVAGLAAGLYYTGAGMYLLAPIQEWIAANAGEGAIERIVEEAVEAAPSGGVELPPGVSGQEGMPLFDAL